MGLAATATGKTTPAWTGGDHRGATDVIAHLEDARMLLGKESRKGTVAENAEWHIDLERPIGGTRTSPAGTTNVQVQRNVTRKNAAEKTTVACLLVQNTYFLRLNGAEANNRIAELTRIIRQGLNASLASRAMQTEVGRSQRRTEATVRVFEVTGDFSSPFQEFESSQKPVK